MEIITPEKELWRMRMGILSATELDAADIKAPRWAIPGVLPQGASLLVGSPKLGKSWLLLNAAVAIASGAPAFGHVGVEQGGVLLLCLEDTQLRLQDRVRRVVNGGEVPPNLHVVTEWPRLDEGGAQELRNYLRAFPDTRLVGIDVMTRLRPADVGKSSSLYQQDYNLMADFKAVADAHGVALVAVHHTRKMPADDPFDRVSGTNGIVGAADTTLVLTRKPNADTAMLYMRGRDVQERESALTFDAQSCCWTLEQDAAKALALTLPLKQRQIADLLAQHGGMTPAEIADALGANHSTIRNQLRTMLNAGNVAKQRDRYHAAEIDHSEHPRQARQSGQALPATDRQRRQGGQVTVPPSIASSSSSAPTDDRSNASSGVQQDGSGHQLGHASEMAAPAISLDFASISTGETGQADQEREEGGTEAHPTPPTTLASEAEQPYWNDPQPWRKRWDQCQFFSKHFSYLENNEVIRRAWRHVIGARLDHGAGRELAARMASALREKPSGCTCVEWLWDVCGPIVAEYDRKLAA